MAKRLEMSSANGDPRKDGGAVASQTCRVCGGPILVEDLHRADRFPQRLCCAVCDAEYGTTRPSVRNY